MKKSLFYVVIFFFVQVIAFAIAFVGNSLVNGSKEPMSVTWNIILQLLFTSSCIILFLWKRWSPVESFRLVGEYSKSAHRQRLYPMTIIGWTVIAALGTIIPSLWLQEHLDFLPDLVSEDLIPLLQHPLGYFVVGIMAPLSEEIIFRGAILRELLSWVNGEGQRVDGLQTARRGWLAIVLSALFFALAHVNPAQMPHAFLLGLLLGWLYWRSGSILPGVVLHVINNTVAFLLARMYPYMDDLTLEQMLGGSQRQVLLAIGFSLCLLLPALFQLHIRMRGRKTRNYSAPRNEMVTRTR